MGVVLAWFLMNERAMSGLLFIKEHTTLQSYDLLP